MRATDAPVPTPFFELEASAKSTIMKGIFQFLADLEFQYPLFREPKRPKGLFGQKRATRVPVPTPFFELKASAKSTVMKRICQFLADLDFQYLNDQKKTSQMHSRNSTNTAQTGFVLSFALRS